jgi:hypothetical protein
MKLLKALFIMFAFGSAMAAQTPQSPNAPQPFPAPGKVEQPLAEMMNSLQTREVFKQLLRQYSPSLSEIFRLDPSLLTNEAFLAPYPRLAEFLKQHPEIAHNPTFFVGEFYGRRLETPEERSYEMFGNVMAGIAVFIAGLTVLSVLSWTVRTVIDHRRWLRVSRLQSEVHSKLLDRLNNNQDLLTYIQTPAGQHFLQSAPISIEPGTRGSAPFNRIVFSVQAGIVLALAGLGLYAVSPYILIQEAAQPLFVVGILAIALGVGFVLSAGAAYILSLRMGLISQPPLSTTSDNAGASPPHA